MDKMEVGLRRYEWEFYDRCVEELGVEGFVLRLWSRWGIEVMDGRSRDLEVFIRIRMIKYGQLEFREVGIGEGVYSLLDEVSRHIGLGIGELMHYLLYREMQGDGVGSSRYQVA